MLGKAETSTETSQGIPKPINQIREEKPPIRTPNPVLPRPIETRRSSVKIEECEETEQKFEGSTLRIDINQRPLTPVPPKPMSIPPQTDFGQFTSGTTTFIDEDCVLDEPYTQITQNPAPTPPIPPKIDFGQFTSAAATASTFTDDDCVFEEPSNQTAPRPASNFGHYSAVASASASASLGKQRYDMDYDFDNLRSAPIESNLRQFASASASSSSLNTQVADFSIGGNQEFSSHPGLIRSHSQKDIGGARFDGKSFSSTSDFTQDFSNTRNVSSSYFDGAYYENNFKRP